MFQPFTAPHFFALAWTGASLVVTIAVRLSTKTSTAQRALDTSLAIAAIGVNIFSLVYFATPPRLSWAQSLPLQLCDLACLCVPVALLWPERCRWARTLVYFWGLGLSSQAFLTPTLTENFPSLRYMQFWLVHLFIVGAAIYDVVCRGYRPSLRDLRLTLLISVVWYVLMLGVNIAIARLGLGEANYGYNGNTRPINPTLIDRLGPWPLRTIWLAIVGTVIVTFWWAIWPVGRRIAARLRSKQSA